MPPKAKYTKEEIAEIAYEAVRKYGEDFLSARNLAAALGTSTAPIFTAFSNIEELRTEVAKRAKQLYSQYLSEGLSGDIPFKGAGLKYIQFAKDEPNLFRMLFMRHETGDPFSHYFPAEDENEPRVRKSLEESYHIGESRAKKIYNHLSVYAHGIAVLYAQGRCVFTDEDVSAMLSEVFAALTKGEQI